MTVADHDELIAFRTARDSLRAAESAYWADPPEKRWERFNAESAGPTRLFLTDSHRDETEPSEYERRRLVALEYSRRQVELSREVCEQESELYRLRAEYLTAAVRLAESVAGGAA